MEQEEDYQEDAKHSASIWQKTFSLFKNIPAANQVNVAPKNEELWKKEIQQKWNIIDKSQISSSSQSQDQAKKEEEQEAGSQESLDQVLMMKIKLENLMLAFQKAEAEKLKLKSENLIMRKQLEQWMKSPIKVRKYARIQGELYFDKDCDEVKVEKGSFVDIEEDNP